jgi:protein Mpv17
MSFLEGKGVGGAIERIENVSLKNSGFQRVINSSIRKLQAYVPTLVRNWGVFIPTQLINFAIVPHHLRFVTVSIVSLFWSRSC